MPCPLPLRGGDPQTGPRIHRCLLGLALGKRSEYLDRIALKPAVEDTRSFLDRARREPWELLDRKARLVVHAATRRLDVAARSGIDITRWIIIRAGGHQNQYQDGGDC